MKNKYILVIMILIVNSLVFISPFVTTDKVQNYDELNDLSFGFPIAFVVQDQSNLDLYVPGNISISSPSESPTTIDFGPFLLSIFIVNFAAFLFYPLAFRRK